MNTAQASTHPIISNYYGYNKNYVTTAFGLVVFTILYPSHGISPRTCTSGPLGAGAAVFAGSVGGGVVGGSFSIARISTLSVYQLNRSVDIYSTISNESVLHTTLCIDKQRMLLELFSYNPIVKPYSSIFLDNTMSLTTIDETQLSEFRFVESNVQSFIDTCTEIAFPCIRAISALENYYITSSAKALLQESITALNLSSADLLSTYVVIMDKREILIPTHMASSNTCGVRSSREYVPLQLDITKSTQSIIDTLTSAICAGIPTKYSVIQLLHSILDNSTDITAVEFFYSVLENAATFRYTVSQPHISVLLYLYEIIQKNFDATV